MEGQSGSLVCRLDDIYWIMRPCMQEKSMFARGGPLLPKEGLSKSPEMYLIEFLENRGESQVV